MAQVGTKPRTRGAVKTTINLPVGALDDLRSIATARNTTFAEVIRRALTVDKILAEATRSGAKILVEEPDKKVKELVIV